MHSHPGELFSYHAAHCIHVAPEENGREVILERLVPISCLVTGPWKGQQKNGLAEPCPNHWPTESGAKKQMFQATKQWGVCHVSNTSNDEGSLALQLEVRAALPWLTCLLQAALQRSSHESLSPKEECDNSGRQALDFCLGRGECGMLPGKDRVGVWSFAPWNTFRYPYKVLTLNHISFILRTQTEQVRT